MNAIGRRASRAPPREQPSIELVANRLRDVTRSRPCAPRRPLLAKSTVVERTISTTASAGGGRAASAQSSARNSAAVSAPLRLPLDHIDELRLSVTAQLIAAATTPAPRLPGAVEGRRSTTASWRGRANGGGASERAVGGAGVARAGLLRRPPERELRLQAVTARAGGRHGGDAPVASPRCGGAPEVTTHPRWRRATVGRARALSTVAAVTQLASSWRGAAIRRVDAHEHARRSQRASGSTASRRGDVVRSISRSHLRRVEERRRRALTAAAAAPPSPPSASLSTMNA